MCIIQLMHSISVAFISGHISIFNIFCHCLMIFLPWINKVVVVVFVTDIIPRSEGNNN